MSMSLDKPTSVADVEAILAENARLLGEPQEVFLRPLADGRFRLQVRVNGQWRRSRGDRKDYPTLALLCWAAGIALTNARKKVGSPGDDRERLPGPLPAAHQVPPPRAVRVLPAIPCSPACSGCS